MKRITQAQGIGYEIVCYYPKENNRETSVTGSVSAIYQTDDVAEVAAFFAQYAWSHVYGDPNYANPTVRFNGERWPEL